MTVTTPMGNFRPKFMPEGLACASLKFMEAINLCFDDLNDGWDRKWCYVLHDNILIGGFSDDDLYQKIKIFLQRCKERNVYLKFEKTNIGQVKQHFFGYDIKPGKFS